MEENDLRNSPLFEGWERQSFVDVEVVFYDTLKWKGIFENFDIANEQLNHIITPYKAEMVSLVKEVYGKKRNIYTQEQKGTGEYFWTGDKRNVVRVDYQIRKKSGYVDCYHHGSPIAYEIRFKKLEDRPYRRLNETTLIYLHSLKESNVNNMFGSCKNVFETCGFSDSTVEEYWKAHEVETKQENSDPK